MSLCGSFLGLNIHSHKNALKSEFIQSTATLEDNITLAKNGEMLTNVVLKEKGVKTL